MQFEKEISQVLILIRDQTMFGWIICGLIVVIAALHIQYSKKTSRYYKNLIEDLEENKAKEKEVKDPFTIETLNKMYNEFVQSVKGGTEHINTQVIIEKNICVKQQKIENLLSYGSSLVIVAGLLGTFIGLTFAIAQIDFNTIDTDSIGNFIRNLNGPLASMSTAFLTSIFGIFSSIILNIVSIRTYRSAKIEFYNNLEDFLDNIVWARYKHDYTKLLYNFTKTVESSMNYMTQRVTETFDQGMSRFEAKIDTISFELRSSSKLLDDVMLKMENTIEDFNSPVMSFKKSVDSFQYSYEGFGGKIKEIKSIVEEFTMELRDVTKAYQMGRGEFEKVAAKLEGGLKNLEGTYNSVNVIIGEIEESKRRNDELFKGNISMIESTHGELAETIHLLNENIKGMSEVMSDTIANALENRSKYITEGILSQLTKPLEDINGIYADVQKEMEVIKQYTATQGLQIDENSKYLDRLNRVANKLDNQAIETDFKGVAETSASQDK